MQKILINGFFWGLQGINIHKMNIYTILCAKRNKMAAMEKAGRGHMKTPPSEKR
jgi:hypothetical protein